MTKQKTTSLFAAAAALGIASVAQADNVINDDLIVIGSACIGLDCSNGENFGFDTLRLKENNTRIGFTDTSASASFPGNDWQLTANDSSNGGANKFSVDDITGGRTPFTLTAGAPSNSMFVNASGNLGLGNGAPVVEVHVTDGDSPTLRLEQNGSSGFGSQTWDIAGNETNFFVRDVSNGSQLPFKIFPGADHNSLVVAATNNVGMGIQLPTEKLHVKEGNVLIDGGNIVVQDNAATSITLDHTTDNNAAFRIQVNDTARFSYVGSGAVEMELTSAGNLTTSGTVTATSFIVGGQALNVPDYVFADDYDLMPLSDVAAFIDANSHLPNIPSAAEINATGLNQTEMQLSLLEKVEELTLYTLAQEERIAALTTQMEALSAD